MSKGIKQGSESLQMMQRPLLTSDELKSLPKQTFVVMKTGAHPMRTRLRLFFDWGIKFGEPYKPAEQAERKVHYAGRESIEAAILDAYSGRVQQPAVQKKWKKKKAKS